MNDLENNVSSAKPPVDLPVIDNAAKPSAVDVITEQLQSNKDIKIEWMFSYHPPKPGQAEKYQSIRDKAKELAYLIKQLCPDSGERIVAMTSLQDSVFWANAAIARNE